MAAPLALRVDLVTNMGLDYSINLYFPAEQVTAALRATASRVSAAGMRGPVEVASADGSRIVFPSDHGWSGPPSPTEQLLLPGTGTLRLTLTLEFPSDGVLRKYRSLRQYERLTHYLDDPEAEDAAGDWPVDIGCIYLTVRAAREFAEFSFTAATSNMSVLFSRSRSIHRTFLELLREAHGVTALLDREDNRYLVLAEYPRTIHLPRRDRLIHTPGLSVDVDRFTRGALQQLAAEFDDESIGWDPLDSWWAPNQRAQCACCGYLTLPTRGGTNCIICDWTDTGQGDAEADYIWYGENMPYSLADARQNFREYGVMYLPDLDLRPWPDTAYERQLKGDLVGAFDRLKQAPRDRWAELFAEIRVIERRLDEESSRLYSERTTAE